MNKRITSLLLCFMMIVCMLVSAVPANATSTEAPITVTIDPDKTTASPGDTITYTVNVGPVKRLQSVNFTLVIPEGLTYVSGKEVDGLKELLGADKAEYTVTVGSSNVVQDVEIWLLGDVTGDGKVNAKDHSRLYAHINKTNLLEGYALLCADVTGDGKVNAKDHSRLYAHISKTNPLW